MLRSVNQAVVAQYFGALKNLRARQVSLVLKAGYDPNLLVNARGHNGLQFLANYFNATRDNQFRLQAPRNKAAYLAIARLLLDAGLDVNAPDLLTGEPIINTAIKYDDVDLVALLANYVDFSTRDSRNAETTLMCAARFASKTTMRILLEHLHALDMDLYFLRQRNRFGATPLDLARAQNLDAAKVLTKHLITLGGGGGAGGGYSGLVAADVVDSYGDSRRFTAAPVVSARRPSRFASTASELLSFDSLTANDDALDALLLPPTSKQRGAPATAIATTTTAAAAAMPTSAAANVAATRRDSFVNLATSDDEAEFYGLGRGVATYGGGQGGLSRSRSCAFLNSVGASASTSNAYQSNGGRRALDDYMGVAGTRRNQHNGAMDAGASSTQFAVDAPQTPLVRR